MCSLNETRQWLNNNESISTSSSIFQHSKSLAFSDNFLLRFLRVQKFDVSKACKMLEKYLILRTEHPEWFANWDLAQDINLYELFHCGYVTVLPDPDKDGRKVILNYAVKFDTSKYNTVV